MKMAGRGHIINISSEAERNPIKGLTVYTGENVKQCQILNVFFRFLTLCQPVDMNHNLKLCM